MQFTQDSHEAIASGAVTLTCRLWKRPHAKVGGRYNVGTVQIQVDDIELVPFHALTPADIRRTGMRTRDEVRARAAHAGPIDDDTLVHRIGFHVVGPRRMPESDASDAAVAGAIAELDAMDARSKHGPWTRVVLRLISDHEGTVSTELAAQVGRPRPEFKADVRKLKALGLTESLEVGYRLSPLGHAVVGDSA